MNEALPYALLEDIPEITIELPDPNDRHVLAAAIQIEADYIVTNNLRDFPNSILEPLGIKAIQPDDFIMLLVQSTPELVKIAIQMQRKNLIHPALNTEQLWAELAAQNLKKFVAWLRTKQAD